MQGFDQHVSSAKQLNDMAESYSRSQAVEREENVVHRRGVEAQIESATTLKEQKVDQTFIRETLDVLLRHRLEQVTQQVERERIEDARYEVNLRFTKIAAWTGVVGVILGACALLFR